MKNILSLIILLALSVSVFAQSTSPRLSSSTDSVTVSGTVGVTGGRYLLPGYDGVRIYGGNSGETMIPVTLRDGSGAAISSTSGALNVNLVGSGFTATVSVGAIVGICQADQAVPLYVAGATAGPAVRVKGLGSGDAVPVIWSSALPVSVNGQVTVDLNSVYNSLTSIQNELDQIKTNSEKIETIYNKLTTGINTVLQKPSQTYIGTLTISSAQTTFSASTALYSGITIKAATTNTGKDVLIKGDYMGFKDLKKNSTSMASKLQEELEKSNKSNDYKDDRFWRPTLDSASNGYAVIRFLPAVEGEDIPWVKLYSHAFKGKGGWFIHNCPTTLGEKCPVCEGNSELWNSGTESEKRLS